MEVSNMSEISFFLVSKESFLQNVILPLSEVSKLTGVSERKIRYWTNSKKLLTNRSGSSFFKYNFQDLQKIFLIKQLRLVGVSLEKANKQAEEAIELIQQRGEVELSTIKKENEERSINTVPSAQYPKEKQIDTKQIIDSILSSEKLESKIEEIIKKH